MHSGRGGYRGGKKPSLPDDKKRVSLSCRVSPKSMAKLEAYKEQSGLSYGEIIDRLMESSLVFTEKARIRYSSCEQTAPRMHGRYFDELYRICLPAWVQFQERR